MERERAGPKKWWKWRKWRKPEILDGVVQLGTLFLAIAIIVCARWFFQSELSAAVGEALRAKHGGAVDPLWMERFDELADRVEEDLVELKGEVADLSERLEFTERVLLEVRGRNELPEGRGSQ